MGGQNAPLIRDFLPNSHQRIAPPEPGH